MLKPRFLLERFGRTAYEIRGSKRLANGIANAATVDAQLFQCAHGAGEKCIADLQSRKASGCLPPSVTKNCPDQFQLLEQKYRASCLPHPLAQDGALD